jgi:hypothetical protein
MPVVSTAEVDISGSLTSDQVMWDTTPFNNPEDWPEDGTQPFVLSNGDT